MGSGRVTYVMKVVHPTQTVWLLLLVVLFARRLRLAIVRRGENFHDVRIMYVSNVSQRQYADGRRRALPHSVCSSQRLLASYAS